MKKFIALLALSGLTLASCANQSPKTEAISSSPPASPVVKEIKEFKAKSIPVLGTSSQQLNDQSAVAMAVLAAGPEGNAIKIPKTSSAGITPNPIAIKQGFIPEGTDVCNLPYSALIKAMVETCVSEGMSYVDVANLIGYKGEEAAKSGNSTTYIWKSNEGMMSATFIDDKLTAKTQQGLK